MVSDVSLSENESGRTPRGQFAAKVPKDLNADDLRLDSPEEILAFQRNVIRWLATGEIGSRQAGSINHALETLLKFHLDSKKLAEYGQYFERIKNFLDSKEAKTA